MSTSLPAEIWLQILKCVEQDLSMSSLKKVATFHAFALTSTTLYEISQPFLYKSVYLANATQPQNFIEAAKARLHIGTNVNNIFYGDKGKLLPEYDMISLTASLFPLAKQVAWVEEEQDGSWYGHQYSIGSGVNASHSTERFIHSYHLIVPDLFERTDRYLPVERDTLTNVTITIWTKSRPSPSIEDAEAAIRSILAACSSIANLVIRIGFNPAAFGSRLERFKRSENIGTAARRVNDEKVSVKVAQYMFGSQYQGYREDVLAYLQESWLQRIEETGEVMEAQVAE